MSAKPQKDSHDDLRETYIKGELAAHIVQVATGPSIFHILLAWLIWYFARDNASAAVTTSLTIGTSVLAAARYYFARSLLHVDSEEIPKTRAWRYLEYSHIGMLLLFCPLYVIAFDPNDPIQQGFLTVAAHVQSLGVAYSFGDGSKPIFYSANLTLFAIWLSHIAMGTENLVYVLSMIVSLSGIPYIGIRVGAALRERVELQYTADQLILELKIARQEADEANAAKSKFLAHASHDLRQPLHAIGLFLESLPEEFDDTRTAYTVARIRQSQRQLSELFDTLLDVSVIDIGEVDIKISEFSLGDLLAQIVNEFRIAADEAGINLRFVPTSLWVRADPQLLGRMVRNLLSNALRFSEDGTVLVGCRRSGGTVSVDVLDQGQGMSTEGASRAFDEFERLEEDHNTQSKPGFGLGLTIVLRLAELQNLQVTSRSTLGHGSAFRIGGLHVVTTPISSSQEADKASTPDAQQTRVLVIDDDPEVLDASRILLEKWNFAVDTQQEFDPNSIKAPGILICDYELGNGVNGIDVVSQARTLFGEDMRAIIISGTTHDSLAQRTRAAGLPLLHKPVKPSQLRSALLSTQAR
ncbi:MAG: hybrid sensor histidine kinase/response regulator [Pseudomonadota bacterium]